MPLTTAIADRCTAQPDAPAFIYEGRLINYGQFHALLSVVTAKLHSSGIRYGHAVGIALGQTPLHIVTVIALGQLGATAVPLSIDHPPDVRSTLCSQYAIRMMIVADPLAAVAGVPAVNLQTVNLRGDERGFVTLHHTGVDVPMRIALTSGTTGMPKGIAQTQREFKLRCERTLGSTTADTRLLVTDLHMTVSMAMAIGTLLVGGTVVFPRSMERNDTLSAMAMYAVTHTAMMPHYARLLIEPLSKNGPAFPAIRHFRLIGAMPSSELLHQLQSRLSPNIHIAYALTEVGVISMARPDSLLSGKLSAGRISDWVDAEIVNHNGAPVTPGEKGAVRVKLEGMPHAYCGKVDSKRFSDGWFYTGDIGHIDEDGDLIIDGREDELINIAGFKAYPHTIEQIVEQFPGVSRAGCYVIGEALHASFCADQPVNQTDLKGFCDSRLGALSPTVFTQTDRLPTTPAGKIQREKLGSLRGTSA